jgi:uncharacterized protein
MVVKSPCIDVWAFDGKTGFVSSAFGRETKIRAWKKMTDSDRLCVRIVGAGYRVDIVG